MSMFYNKINDIYRIKKMPYLATLKSIDIFVWPRFGFAAQAFFYTCCSIISFFSRDFSALVWFFVAFSSVRYIFDSAKKSWLCHLQHQKRPSFWKRRLNRWMASSKVPSTKFHSLNSSNNNQFTIFIIMVVLKIQYQRLYVHYTLVCFKKMLID